MSEFCKIHEVPHDGNCPGCLKEEAQIQRDRAEYFRKENDRQLKRARMYQVQVGQIAQQKHAFGCGLLLALTVLRDPCSNRALEAVVALEALFDSMYNNHQTVVEATGEIADSVLLDQIRQLLTHRSVWAGDLISKKAAHILERAHLARVDTDGYWSAWGLLAGRSANDDTC